MAEPRYPKTAPACGYQTQGGPCVYHAGHVGDHGPGAITCPARHHPSDPRWGLEAGTCLICLLDASQQLRLRVEALEQDADGLRAEVATLRLRVAPLEALAQEAGRVAQLGAQAITRGVGSIARGMRGGERAAAWLHRCAMDALTRLDRAWPALDVGRWTRAQVCPACQRAVPLGARSCPACGHSTG